MPSAPRILERLPSLYRPEPGYDDDDPLLQLVAAVGDLIDELSAASAEVMQAHWLNYADSALYSAWLGRRRELRGDGPLAPGDPLIDTFPYLADLPRLASLVDMSPWREPLSDRERVETFRRRIHRIIRLHRDGLGTLAALRNMTLAALPLLDADAPPGLRERSFTVEEFTGARRAIQAVSQDGIPGDQVGPLMRWRVDSDSLAAVAPLVIIEGVAAVAGVIDATEEPIIERFDPDTGTGVGLHYQGVLAAGEALALVPGYACWLGVDAGVALAQSIPQGTESVDPTAAGPWTDEASAPADAVIAIQQTQDLSLWAATGNGGGSLWRRDDSSWTQIFDGLPEIRCLLSLGPELLVGFATGLARLDIQPAGAFALIPDPATLADAAVHALAVDRDGVVWAATALGLARLESGSLVYTDLGNRSATQTALFCVAPDPGGDIYCGGELGLFLHRPGSNRWFLLQDEAVDEAVDDWLAVDLATGSLPASDTVFVPPVLCVVHGPDTHLWLGTSQGIARYRAREQRRTYTTLLEAFPYLTQAAVPQIRLDARNRLWFATGEGLFVFDQLDWFQRQGDALARLPRQLEEPEQPVFWRFLRATDTWQSLAPPSNAGFENFSGSQLGLTEPAVYCIEWTSRAHARLGSFDGSEFTVDTAAVPAALAVRYKPDVTRIVDGGLAGLPLLAAGSSDWRYLQREEAAPPAPGSAPAWTREGRLLPPPASLAAPFEGRHLGAPEGPEMPVFSFNPAARVWFSWRPRTALAVTVRLQRNAPDEQLDPQILDRVWRELQRVKPAAVAVYLAVGETIERGL